MPPTKYVTKQILVFVLQLWVMSLQPSQPSCCMMLYERRGCDRKPFLMVSHSQSRWLPLQTWLPPSDSWPFCGAGTDSETSRCPCTSHRSSPSPSRCCCPSTRFPSSGGDKHKRHAETHRVHLSAHMWLQRVQYDVCAQENRCSWLMLAALWGRNVMESLLITGER